MAKILITGATGFCGSHLCEYLLTLGHNIYTGARWRAPLDNVRDFWHKTHVTDIDIRDSVSVSRMIADIKPDFIFHLAAQSYVTQSWSAPGETLFTNVIGTLNILEAVKQLPYDPIVQFAGSSEEYGLVTEGETPINESNPLRPMSPYGVSKVAGDLLCQQYHKSYGIKTVITRAFNHEGQRRGKPFVTSNFAWQIAMIEAGLQEPVIKVGNLEAQRDFTDVHDMVKAYWYAVTACEYGTPYNICSGKAWRIADVLKYLVSLSTVKNIKIEQDEERMRPSDVPLLLGDCTKFYNQTGWRPVTPFERTLENTLNFWRNTDLKKELEKELVGVGE